MKLDEAIKIVRDAGYEVKNLNESPYWVTGDGYIAVNCDKAPDAALGEIITIGNITGVYEDFCDYAGGQVLIKIS